jgi:hypothetical protein
MADFGINPQIPLGAQGAKRTSLGELLGTATKALELEKLSELYPSLIKKTQAEADTSEFALQQKRVQSVTNNLTAAINEPLLVKLEQDPNSVPQQEVMSFLKRYGNQQAEISGVPKDKAEQMLAPYYQIAQNDPGQLRQYFKTRLLAGLDDSSRVSTMGGTNPMGLSTIPPNQPAFRRPGVTPEAMTAPLRGPIQGQNLMVAPVTENQVGISAIPGGAPTMAQAPAMAAPAPIPMAAGQMVQPEVSNFPLMFEPPARAGINRPKREGEDKAIDFGTTLRGNLAKRQLDLTKSRSDLDEVIRTATKIKQDAILPETGLVGAAKRKVYELAGDPTYQKLRKDIANVVKSNQDALSVGGNSVAGLELTKEAAGDITYDPTVIVDIARRAKADLTNLDMMATGMQKHYQKYGDANAQRFTQMWSANADSKIFQLMDINRDITDPKLRQAAASKVLEGMSQAQREALNQNYQRIVRLTNTGDIAQ